MKNTIKLAAPNVVTLSRGLYRRIARKMNCDPSFVSRVARGERRSVRVEAELKMKFREVLKKLKQAEWGNNAK